MKRLTGNELKSKRRCACCGKIVVLIRLYQIRSLFLSVKGLCYKCYEFLMTDD
jgi:hypothetical protein